MKTVAQTCGFGRKYSFDEIGWHVTSCMTNEFGPSKFQFCNGKCLTRGPKDDHPHCHSKKLLEKAVKIMDHQGVKKPVDIRHEMLRR